MGALYIYMFAPLLEYDWKEKPQLSSVLALEQNSHLHHSVINLCFENKKRPSRAKCETHRKRGSNSTVT